MEIVWENWLPYGIAAVIGLLIGIEREKAHPASSTMGVRTFLLISMLGALSGGLDNPWLAGLIAAFTLSLVVISYFTQTNTKTPKVDRGLTTEFAAGIIFVLGFMAHQAPAFSALMGPLMALALFSKKSLHRITRAIKPNELEAALIILLIGVVVVRFFPNKTVDPWGIFNPKKFGYIILTLATLEFLSYTVTKVLGEKGGALIIGFFGGLVSSTSVLLSSARQAKKYPEKSWMYASSAVIAKLAALIELFLIIGMVSPPLLAKVALPVALMMLVGLGALGVIGRKKVSAESILTLTSPLDLKGVVRLSVLLASILALISVAELWFGDRGTFVLSFLTGLFELHGVSLATSTMHSQNHLSLETASASIFLAIIASFAAKISIAWALAPGAFARTLTAIFVPMIALIAAAAWFTL